MQRDRVDREVAALEILVQRGAQLDDRKRSRPLVALPPRAREIERRARGLDGRGPEAIVDDHPAAQALGGAPRHGHRVSLDDDVQLVRRAAEQHVAHGAADHVHGVLAGERGDGGRPAEAVDQIHGAHLGGWLPS
jgi:hypothetical protein